MLHRETYSLDEEICNILKEIPQNGFVDVSHWADKAIFYILSVYCLQLLPEAILHQTAKQGLLARIRFARANSIFIFAACFGRPRYRAFQ